MSYKTTTIAILLLGSAGLVAPIPASALDIGGKNGVSVNSSSSGLSVSVGGASGVNANVGSSSSGGLGVNASVGGASGINSNTSVGGSSRGLGVSTTASVGGSRGVNADVGANVGSSSLATAKATVGLGGNTIADVNLGVPSVSNPTGPGTSGPGTTGPGTTGNPKNALLAYDDMSSAEQAKIKVRCKDVLRSGGFDASLVKLCKMVIAMR